MSAFLISKEVQAIAKEAYIALYPLVVNYGTMYQWAIDRTSDEWVGFNTFNNAVPLDPTAQTVVLPNVNTAYSAAVLDLREEPWVLTMPPADGNRYYTSQWDDMWGYVIDSPGSVFDGQLGARYLLATSDYHGGLPKGIKRIIYSESYFAESVTRTALLNERDTGYMSIQSGYGLQPLSSYLGIEAPPKAPTISWIPYDEGDLEKIDFFKYANFMLSYIIPNSADTKMLRDAARIGVAAGWIWDPKNMTEERQKDISDGINEARSEMNNSILTTHLAQCFNTRAVLGEDYLSRAVGVMLAQFGNYPSQALYPQYTEDSEKKPLNAETANYTLTFPKGQPGDSCNYFWSITMYNSDRFLVPNDKNRYSLGSQTIPPLETSEDGSVTIYVQSDSPGKDKERNWLPAPTGSSGSGSFSCTLRLYGPKDVVKNETLPPMIAHQKRVYK